MPPLRQVLLDESQHLAVIFLRDYKMTQARPYMRNLNSDGAGVAGSHSLKLLLKSDRGQRGPHSTAFAS